MGVDPNHLLSGMILQVGKGSRVERFKKTYLRHGENKSRFNHLLSMNTYQKKNIHFFIWVFPKIGGPPKSSILTRFSSFSIINHPFWGTPIFGNTHINGCTISSSNSISRCQGTLEGVFRHTKLTPNLLTRYHWKIPSIKQLKSKIFLPQTSDLSR